MANDSAPQIMLTSHGFSVSGGLTFDNVVPLLKEGVSSIQASNLSAFVIDLSQLKEQNAVVIALMLAWLRTARSLQLPLQYVNMSMSLQRMLDTFGLSELLLSE